MIKKFSDILLNLLSKEKIPDWNNKLVKDLGYNIFKKCFDNNEKVYDEFFNELKDNDVLYEKYNSTVRFYYFWCKDPYLEYSLKPDFKLIVMFSIIETLMSEMEFIPLDNWLYSKERKGEIKIKSEENLNEALEKYFSKYGYKKKIRAFYEKYYEKEDLNILMSGLKKWDETKSDFIKVSDLKDLINFVEGIRNLFIHNSTYIQIGSEKDHIIESEGIASYSSSTLTYVNGVTYDIDNQIVNIEQLLAGFEKAIIQYLKDNI